MSDLEDNQLSRAALTGIQCTLADLQLVQNVLIDVTVTVSRDYGILCTGVCKDISLDAAEQFGYTVQELKNLAMQLKQNTGWVPMRERWSSRKRKKQDRAEERRKAKEQRQQHHQQGNGNDQSNNVKQEEERNPFLDLQMDVTAIEEPQIVINQVSTSDTGDVEEDEGENDGSIQYADQSIRIKEEPPEMVLVSDAESELVKAEISGVNTWSNPSEQDSDDKSVWSHLYPNVSHTGQNRVGMLPSQPGPSHTVTLASLGQDMPHNSQDTGQLDLQDEANNRQTFQYGAEDSKAHLKLRDCGRPFSPGQSLKEPLDLESHKFSIIHQNVTVSNLTSPLKRFQCNVCTKVFAEKHQVLRHYRLHTGEKPFSCPVCLKRFTRKDTMEVHMKRHTKKLMTMSHSTMNTLDTDNT